jgi:hypothetical protein
MAQQHHFRGDGLRPENSTAARERQQLFGWVPKTGTRYARTDFDARVRLDFRRRFGHCAGVFSADQSGQRRLGQPLVTLPVLARAKLTIGEFFQKA